MDDITQAHAQLLRDSSIQFERAEHLAPAPSPEFRSASSAGDGSWLFWTVTVAFLAGTAVIVLRQLLARSGGPAKAKAAPERAQPDHPPRHAIVPAGALPEADALASAGRYGEAVHVLLLRGVAAIERSFPRELGPSLTSRDIARLTILPSQVRSAFGGIAERTERAVFAQHDLTRTDWETCRSLYAGLAGVARP